MIIIWGHGLKHTPEILEIIENNSKFIIEAVVKKNVKNISKIINNVYAYDYAPISHLRHKTKYLKTVEKKLAYILVRNLEPEEDYDGNGDYRHIESMTLKELKSTIRQNFNPRINGKITHDHIIHGTDNINQVKNILQLAGLNESILQKNEMLTPWFINVNNHKYIKIKLQNLYCRNLQDDGTTCIIPIEESIQYQHLQKNDGTYEAYISKHLGNGLQSYYSMKKFNKLKLSIQNEFNQTLGPIVIEENNDKMIILDGLHRCAILLNSGIKETTICKVS